MSYVCISMYIYIYIYVYIYIAYQGCRVSDVGFQELDQQGSISSRLILASSLSLPLSLSLVLSLLLARSLYIVVFLCLSLSLCISLSLSLSLCGIANYAITDSKQRERERDTQRERDSCYYFIICVLDIIICYRHSSVLFYYFIVI